MRAGMATTAEPGEPALKPTPRRVPTCMYLDSWQASWKLPTCEILHSRSVPAAWPQPTKVRQTEQVRDGAFPYSRVRDVVAGYFWAGARLSRHRPRGALGVHHVPVTGTERGGAPPQTARRSGAGWYRYRPPPW